MYTDFVGSQTHFRIFNNKQSRTMARGGVVRLDTANSPVEAIPRVRPSPTPSQSRANYRYEGRELPVYCHRVQLCATTWGAANDMRVATVIAG